MADADARIAAPEVKAQLRRNGEEAVARGVFGVPTLLIDEMLFWGADAIDMAADYLRGDPVFGSEQMRRAGSLPEGKLARGAELSRPGGPVQARRVGLAPLDEQAIAAQALGLPLGFSRGLADLVVGRILPRLDHHRADGQA